MIPNTNPILLQYLYNASPEEITIISNRVKGYSDEQITQFCQIYQSKRKDPQLILITCLLGFVGIAGVQRFLTDQIGMGILYFFTAGLCLIGTIVDLINYKELAIEYNGKKIAETLMMMGMISAK
ncbi:MAG: TM2 domain-containing protein [Chitinophagaceae bacterium]|nr:TM2 domain-containing protein [Chitinophagaceae bacterium]